MCQFYMKEIYEKFLDRVKKEKSVKIFGAGKFAKTLCYFLIRNGIEVEAFVVTDVDQNPVEILHRPVIGLHHILAPDAGSIVVGFENRTNTNEVLTMLLDYQVQHIIIVPFGIINDIYCNFIIDESSLETFCREMRKQEKIVAYVNDAQGEILIQYLLDQQVPIEAAYTDIKEMVFNSVDTPLSLYEQIKNRDRESTILLAMNAIYRQRWYITRLRKEGFEKIILLSDEIIKEIKDDHRRSMWESGKTGFCFVNTTNVEEGHYIVQKKKSLKVYRWRVPIWKYYPYEKETLDLIKSGKVLEGYERQFHDCYYLPYTEVPLEKVEKSDNSVVVYMAKFHKDRKIEQVSFPEWIVPIQVGKALTDIRIAELCDNTGDHISFKNVDYSEGTALYWMWKNTKGQDYIGLFHYRRQMAMGYDSLRKLSEYDVLLTVPTFTSIRIKEFFCKSFVWDYDWKLMMQYIKDYDEQYYETALKYEDCYSYFPCNIFIMRRQYFDEMCGLIFGVLEQISRHYEKLGLIRKDRYLGYLLENLLSIYMMHNAARLKMAYTDMKYYPPLDENE